MNDRSAPLFFAAEFCKAASSSPCSILVTSKEKKAFPVMFSKTSVRPVSPLAVNSADGSARRSFEAGSRRPRKTMGAPRRRAPSNAATPLAPSSPSVCPWPKKGSGPNRGLTSAVVSRASAGVVALGSVWKSGRPPWNTTHCVSGDGMIWLRNDCCCRSHDKRFKDCPPKK